MRLDIENLKFNNTEVNLTILSGDKIGVYSRNKKLVKDFLELLSGIRENGRKILYAGNTVFDNSDYFKNRIYLDFENNYFQTLDAFKIKRKLKRFNINFDIDNFNNLLKELNIRRETSISFKYSFSKIGNTYVNFAFSTSLDKAYLIVNNPTINLKEEQDLSFISEKLINSNYSNLILGLDKIGPFKDKLDKVIMFCMSGNIHILNSKDTIVVFSEDISNDFLIKNIICKEKNIVAINNFSKEQFKEFNKAKIKYKIISIYEIDKYIGEV